MSRTRVASMEPNQARRLNAWAMEALKRELLSWAARSLFSRLKNLYWKLWLKSCQD